jgi:hypothetical protein
MGVIEPNPVVHAFHECTAYYASVGGLIQAESVFDGLASPVTRAACFPGAGIPSAGG